MPTAVELVDLAVTVAMSAIVLAVITALLAGARAAWKLPARMDRIEHRLEGLATDLTDHMANEETERREIHDSISKLHGRIDTALLGRRRGDP